MTPWIEQLKEQESPRVAAIHDLSGMGSCALSVVLPTLSALGITPCPVPTALLAAHTDFPVYTFFDASPLLEAYFDCWERLGISLAGAYTGFLGSEKQIEAMLRFFERHPEMQIVIDPVMGDGGQRYRTYTDELCAAMRELSRRAYILTPNLTEASILLDLPYLGQDLSAAKAEEVLDRLLALGAKNVVLKGIERGDGRIVNALKGSESGYRECSHRLRSAKFHGTGDLFASLAVAGHFRGLELPEAVRLAGDLAGEAVELTLGAEIYPGWGISFTPLLPHFHGELEKALRAGGR